MRNLVILLCRLTVVGAVLYMALRPDGGVVYLGPVACLGLMLVGLGLCVDAHRREVAAAGHSKQG